MKSSHINKKVNSEFENWLNMEVGEYGSMTTRRGKLQDFLGIDIDYTNIGEVIIDMKKDISDILQDFPLQF